jgi:hypothetical protein
MLFNADNLAYQIQILLYIVKGSKGQQSMLQSRGVILWRLFTRSKGNSYQHTNVTVYGKEEKFCFFQSSLYTAHVGEGMAALDFGEHFNMEVLLEIKILANQERP